MATPRTSHQPLGGRHGNSQHSAVVTMFSWSQIKSVFCMNYELQAEPVQCGVIRFQLIIN